MLFCKFRQLKSDCKKGMIVVSGGSKKCPEKWRNRGSPISCFGTKHEGPLFRPWFVLNGKNPFDNKKEEKQ